MARVGVAVKPDKDLFRKGDAACAVETFGPISLGDIRDHDIATGGTAGMDKAVITEIDANMRKSPAQGVKKH